MSNKVLADHQAYLSYIGDTLATQEVTQVRLATFALYRWKAYSQVDVVLPMLEKYKAEILVGYGTLQTLERCLAIAKNYPGVKWRFSPRTHAKYALFCIDGHWRGAVGSHNLSDSGQWNLSLRASAQAAKCIAMMHEQWVRSASNLTEAEASAEEAREMLKKGKWLDEMIVS